MSESIPESFADLFDKKAFAHLGLQLRDGSLSVHPVWCDYDGETVNFVSSKVLAKYHSIQRNPRIALCLTDPVDPYRYMEIRGTVREFREEGADALLDALALKYEGIAAYPDQTQRGNRVIYRLTPEKVRTFVSARFSRA